MFGRKEKGEERKGWREKWREKGEVGVWYVEKSGGKGKVEGKMCVWDPLFCFLPKVGGKGRERNGCFLGDLNYNFILSFFNI